MKWASIAAAVVATLALVFVRPELPPDPAPIRTEAVEPMSTARTCGEWGTAPGNRAPLVASLYWVASNGRRATPAQIGELLTVITAHCRSGWDGTPLLDVVRWAV